MVISIRLANLDDAAVCNAFHNDIYGNSRSIKQWLWTFNNQLYSDFGLAFVMAEDDGKLIGTQALIPIPMIDRKGIYWTAKSEETLVDPDYRGQSLFERMYEKIFKIAKEHNFHSIWGFTQARKAFERVGFAIPTHTSQLFRPMGLRSFIVLSGLSGGITTNDSWKNAVKTGALYSAGAAGYLYANIRSRLGNFSVSTVKDIVIKNMEAAPKEAGILCREFINQWGGTTIYRDQAYLNWRIFNNPFIRANMIGAYVDGKLVGYCAFTLAEDQIGHIVDILVTSPDHGIKTAREATRLLLSEATKRLSDMGAHGVRAWSMTNHEFDRLLANCAKNLGYLFFDRGTSVVVNTSHQTMNKRDVDRYLDWSVSRIFTEGRTG